jgi:uncharacterized protein
MNEQLERLIRLQQIDAKILLINRVIGEFPRKLAEAELPFRELQKTLDSAKQMFDTFEKKKRDKERALDDTGEKINKLKARTSEIKTNKEYQALLKEIESIEKERASVEDEILLIMEELDAASKRIKAEEQKVKADGQKIEALKKTFESERLASEKELSIAQDMRTKIAETVDRDIYGDYVILIEACGGTAVVEARNEICQGCNMNIPPQLFVELKKDEEILNCPQCRRIIYYKNSQ